MIHRKRYQEIKQIPEPRSFEMTQVNDSNNTLIITPELRVFVGKAGVPQCAGNNNREEILPFNT